MTCYNPLIRIEYVNERDGLTKDGRPKHKYKIYSLKNMDRKALEEMLKETKFKARRKEAFRNWITLIPCGKCIGCRLEYSKDWATRCVCESKLYKNNFMVTLTYNDENLPYKEKLNFEKDGKKYVFIDPGDWAGILKVEDFEKFNNSLRDYFRYHHNATGIRFFGCGEYGEKKKRPHYHLIYFNLPLSDLELIEYDDNYNPIYRSDELEKIWGKGHVYVNEVNWSTAAYVARYIMKKIKGDKQTITYAANGQIPEFVRMSRMPGIGLRYLEQNWKDIYKKGYILCKKYNGSFMKCRPPKYFNDWLKKNHYEEYKAYKNKTHLNMLRTERTQQLLTDNDMIDMFNLQAMEKNAQVSMLLRSLE